MTKRLKEQIRNLPQKPGVYILKDKSERILYVGKAAKLRNRVRSHFTKSSVLPGQLIKAGIKKVSKIDFIKTDNEQQALILENELIKKYQPRYNIEWRDDKNYFYVLISDEKWPRISLTHQIKREALSAYRLLRIIGPFTNGRQLKKLLQNLRKALPFRTCKNSTTKPCLGWHIGLCPAHLTKRGADVKYRYSLKLLIQMLKIYQGKSGRIEAYDISNIHGTSATGSMVVFEKNKPKKSDYRRFKIKTIKGANDVAMIKEVIKRRLKHTEWPYPDLILIDGGKAQLNSASKKLKKFNYQKRSALLSLAKKEEKIYTEYSKKTLKLSKLPNNLAHTLMHIRDEAHRFAIAYHKKLRGKDYR